jgi:hypothetical protein
MRRFAIPNRRALELQFRKNSNGIPRRRFLRGRQKARWASAHGDDFHLIVVSPTFQHLEHAVLRQGRQSIRKRCLKQCGGGCPGMDKLLYFVGDDQ